MSIEIKRWTDGEVIYTAENAQDVREALQEAARENADLRYADLDFADLGSANLRSANLRSADLGFADLGSANLRFANLRFANLGYADLRYAEGVHPTRVTPLHILLDQVGKIRAYKLVNADGEGPFNGGLTYEVGETVEVADADTDPDNHCGAGINVATLPWCIDNWRREGYRVLLVEFTRADIACIPTATDGKFRVRRCKVIREVDVTEIVCPEEASDA